MFNIKNIQIEIPIVSELNPIQLQFTENTTKRTWDLIETNDTVGIILFNTSTKKLLALKRFEPAVYLTHILKEDRKSFIDMHKYPEDLGVVIELCESNLKNINDEYMLEVIKSTILERIGYDVSSESIEFVSSFKSDVGPKCGNIFVYYCEVNNEMKVGSSQRIGEIVMEMDILEVKEYIGKSYPDMRSSPVFLYGMLWFMRKNK